MVWGMIVAAALGAPTSEVELKQALETVRGVGPNGRNSAAAAQAWQKLAAADVAALPTLLAGMDGASPLARNWIRSAVDPVLERADQAKQPLPAAALEEFLRDGRHDSHARRLAYELVVKADPKAPDRLLPGLLDDPNPDLRRDAVTRLLADADKLFDAGQKDEAKPQYQKALAAARDFGQLNRITKRLGELGQTVRVSDHVGFLRTWKAIGPFPNPGEQGISTPYPPEQGLDFAGEYDGKSGKVRWKEYESKANDGVIDLNEAVAVAPESVAYATTVFHAQEGRDAEVRLGSFNAFKLWVNGELVLVRGDAYTGFRPDHYVAKVRLKPGPNTILIKVAQETPPPQLPPPNHWRFMLRVCDGTGAAIPQKG